MTENSAPIRVALDERPELTNYGSVPAYGNGPHMTIDTSYVEGVDVDHAVIATAAVPTQVANPRRTTWRSVFQLALAIFTTLPQIVPLVLGTWDSAFLTTALLQVVAVQTLIVRVMALPQVQAWLVEHAPGLAAIPSKQIPPA